MNNTKTGLDSPQKQNPIAVQLLIEIQNEIYEIRNIKNEINYAMNRIVEPDLQDCDPPVKDTDYPTRVLDVLKTELTQLTELRRDFSDIKSKLDILF